MSMMISSNRKDLLPLGVSFWKVSCVLNRPCHLSCDCNTTPTLAPNTWKGIIDEATKREAIALVNALSNKAEEKEGLKVVSK